MVNGYLGTYNINDGNGVYHFDFNEDNGKIASIKSLYHVDKATYVVSYKDNLITSMNKHNRSGISLLDSQGNLLDESLEEDKVPCFVLAKDDFVYTANYHDGLVRIYRIKDKQLDLVKQINVVNKAGCHQVILHGKYLLVPCLLIDEVRIYDTTNDYALVNTIRFPQGSGPRHGVFNKEHTRLFLVSELSNELFTFAVDGLNFEILNKIALLTPSQQHSSPAPSSAAIRLTENEQFLYISTRGTDILSVIKIDDKQVKPQIIQQCSCGGAHPRDFSLSPNEQYLVVANRDTNNLVSFLLDKTNGKILQIADKASLPSGTCVAWGK